MHEETVGGYVGPVSFPDVRNVAGTRVTPHSPTQFGTWLVVTVIPTPAGRWSITNIDIAYTSWWRHRTKHAVLSVTGWAGTR